MRRGRWSGPASHRVPGSHLFLLRLPAPQGSSSRRGPRTPSRRSRMLCSLIPVDIPTAAAASTALSADRALTACFGLCHNPPCSLQRFVVLSHAAGRPSKAGRTRPPGLSRPCYRAGWAGIQRSSACVHLVHSARGISTASVPARQPISTAICRACVPADCPVQRLLAPPGARPAPPRSVSRVCWPGSVLRSALLRSAGLRGAV